VDVRVHREHLYASELLRQHRNQNTDTQFAYGIIVVYAPQYGHGNYHMSVSSMDHVCYEWHRRLDRFFDGMTYRTAVTMLKVYLA
jgi:hypothetical protein